MPEAQRTQGIESITWMIFFSQNNFKLTSVRNMIKVIDSIPWVRCASGNVFSQLYFNFFFQLCLNFFSTFLHLFSTFFLQFFSTFSQLILNFFQFFSIFVLLFPPYKNFLNLFLIFLNFFNLSGGIPCISSYFGHQVALFELLANVATRWHNLY